MSRGLVIAAAAVVIGATVVLALVIPPEPTQRYLWALVGLVLAQLWCFAVPVGASWSSRVDALDAIPAVLASIPVLVISVIGLVLDPGPVLATILYVIGWSIAIVSLLLVLGHSARTAARTDDPAGADFTIKRGSA